MESLGFLLHLGKKGALDRFITITTPNVGSELGISQQSVSRWLIKLDANDMIARKDGIRGYMVQITPKGRQMLADMRNELNDVMASSRKIVLRGKVVSGMLDGKYYLSLAGYTAKIKSKLGFKPFPGTLNIRMQTEDDIQCKERLCALSGIDIPGFRLGDRILGAIRCFPCDISGIRGAALIPERSHYGNDVLELISPHNLRNKLNLSDGHEIKVEVDRECASQ